MAATDPGFVAAFEQARLGEAEGGIPVGAAIISQDGTIIGRGRNGLVQKKSGVTHAETNAIDSCHSLPASSWENSTLYTTLSPCDMCTGAIILYGVKLVVIGHSPDPGKTTGELYMKQRGVKCIWLKDRECEKIIRTFLEKEGGRDVWENEPWADGRGESKAL